MTVLKQVNPQRSPVVAELLTAAANAARSGDRDRAQKLLRRAADTDPYDETIWWELLAVVATHEDRLVCLENILAINPSNAEARRLLRLANIGYDVGDLTPAPPAEALSAAPADVRPLSTLLPRPLARRLTRIVLGALVIAVLIAALLIMLTLLNNGLLTQ